MPVFNNALAGAAGSGGDAGYTIQRSLRFNDSDSAHLSKTFSAGNSQKWTWAAWVKRNKLGGYQTLFGHVSGASGQHYIDFGGDKIRFTRYVSSNEAALETEAVYRDPSAWMHVCAIWDVGNSTANHRQRLFVNGLEVTEFSTRVNPSQNYTGGVIGTAIEHHIGKVLSQNYGAFQLADVHFLDGAVAGIATDDVNGSTTGVPNAAYLTDFGEFDADTGVWNPIEFTPSTEYSTSAITSTTSLTNSFTTNDNNDAFGSGNIDEGTYSRKVNGGILEVTLSPAQSGNFVVYTGSVNENSRYTIIFEDSNGSTYTVLNNSTSPRTGPGNTCTVNAGQRSNIVGFTVDCQDANDSQLCGVTLDGNRLVNGSAYGKQVTLTDGTNLSEFPVNTVVSNGDKVIARNTTNNTLSLDGTSWATGQVVTKGGYGTNGFHLNFSDNSSTAALGTDSSGNSNTWTVNNITSVVANNTDGVNNVSNITQLEEDNIVLSTNITNLHSVLNSSEFQDADTDQTTHGIRVGEADKRFGIKWSGLTGLTGISLRWQRASTYDADVKVTGTGITQTTTTLTSSRVKTTFSTTSTSGELLMEDVTTGSTNGFQLRSIEFDGYGLVTYPTNVENFTFPGADQDSLLDSPTSYEAQSGNNGGNYAVWNVLDKGTSTTLSQGNLKFSGVSSSHRGVRSTIMPTSKVYAEMTVEAAQSGFGLANASADLDTHTLQAGKWAFYSGEIRSNGTTLASVTAASVGDTIQIAYDPENNKAWIGLNNTWYSSSGATTGNPSTGANATFTINDDVFVMGHTYNDNDLTVNFGARPFLYTPPTGFKSLCTQNLDDPLIANGSNYFDVALYTGNGTTGQSITGLEFSPDLVWIKERSSTGGHSLVDTVRGVTKPLMINTNTEYTKTEFFDSFDSNGFTIDYNGVDSSLVTNRNNQTYAAWAWDAGDAANPTSNTDGSVTSQVRVNQTAGFSIVSWTASNSANGTYDTIGHGLNATPGLVLTKRRTVSDSWYSAHGFDLTQFATLNSQGAFSSAGTAWGNGITSSVIGMRIGNFVGANDSMIAYCFAPVTNYSAFGSYEGNSSSDGPFVYTGFRPRWIMYKWADGSGEWAIRDTARSPYNVSDQVLSANSSGAEQDHSVWNVDILSNGFKIRTSSAGSNSSSTFIYAAFAESPLKYARAR